MNHTSLYSPAAEHHRTLAGTHSHPTEGRRLSWPSTAKTYMTVILKYAGTMAPMAPILLVVGGAKAELAQALVLCETGAM